MERTARYPHTYIAVTGSRRPSNEIGTRDTASLLVILYDAIIIFFPSPDQGGTPETQGAGLIISRLHGLALAVQRNPGTGKIEPGSAVQVAPTSDEGRVDDDATAKGLTVFKSDWRMRAQRLQGGHVVSERRVKREHSRPLATPRHFEPAIS